jgi:hypothetical protein
MADPKKTKSKPEEGSQSNRSSCCDGNFEEMFSKIQECCEGKEKSFDCYAIMKRMFNESSKEPQK